MKELIEFSNTKAARRVLSFVGNMFVLFSENYVKTHENYVETCKN